MSPPPVFNIAADSLAHGLGERADRPAIRFFDHAFEERAWTHRQLRDASLRAAGGLVAAGVERGDRVMIRLPSSLGYAAAALGALAIGAVVVPSTERLTPEEAAFLVEDARVRAIVSATGIVAPALPDAGDTLPEAAVLDVDTLLEAPPVDGCVATGADDPAVLIYTSGTTSHPKGVLHGHRMALGRRPMRDGWTGIGPEDIVLHAGKLNWTYTFGMVLIDALAAGATAVLYDGPNDPHVWPPLVARTGATVFAAVPTVYRQILKYDRGLAEDLASLRHGLTAGEPLSPAVLHAWRDRVGTELYEALGMSECSTYISAGPSCPVREGSPGKPQSGRRVAVLPIDGGETPLPAGEVGLLAVHRSDPGLMLGYWERPDEEREVLRGEWFLGGDLARFDDDGYVWFEGRNNDLMNAFGYRVSPLEVEEVVARIPGVAECAVAERQVREDVSVVCAYVVPGPRPPTRDAVLEACAEHLADYKCPREVVFTERLPRGKNGKLERRRLAELPLARPAPAAPTRAIPGHDPGDTPESE